MISIGNDIVCLKTINADRTRQKKFYSKILSGSEIELFNSDFINSLSFEKFVWLLWSIKESVYKFEKRHQPKLLFSRTKIIVEKIELPTKQITLLNTEHESVSFNEDECFCCVIKFNNKIFYSRSFIYNDAIFTVVNNENSFSNIYWGIKKIESDLYSIQTKKIKNFALDKLYLIFKEDILRIEKSITGFPFLAHKEEMPLSFSHHGYYIGYAFVLS